MSNAKCLGVLKAQGQIIMVNDACNVGGRRTLFQWKALEIKEFNSAILPLSTRILPLKRGRCARA